MWSVDTFGDQFLSNIKLGHSDLVVYFIGQSLLSNVFKWEQDMLKTEWLFNYNSIIFKMSIIVHTKTFVPYEQFDLDNIFKVLIL